MLHLTRTQKFNYTIMYFALLVVVLWLSLLIAPYVTEPLKEMLTDIESALDNPMRIIFCTNSIKVTLIAVLSYTFTYYLIISSKKPRRNGEEHGSAHFEDAKDLAKQYADKKAKSNNLIMTENFSVGYDNKIIPNLNEVVIGGPGSGKTFKHIIPNILNATSSFVCCDPKGTTASVTGNFLKMKEFDVKVLDLKEPSKSWGYNPFAYFRSEDDVMKTITNLFKATTPKGSSTQDPYWDNMAQEYVLGIAMMLYDFAPPDEQNMPQIIECIRYDKVLEDDADYISPMRKLIWEIEEEHPDHLAVANYADVHTGAAKTVQSIQSTAISHLTKYRLESVKQMSMVDELDLKHIADKKTALFLLIPDNDTTLNFIVSMLYIQMFQQLYDRAEEFDNDRLPTHLQVYMDEFANVALPDEFLTILATCRSRNIGISIVLQNLSQLKGIYKEGWENIIGQCSQLLYLGGIEQSTHEYLSKSLGKGTIYTNSFGTSHGRNGNYTKNEQTSARELMTPEEVAGIDKNKSILIVQSEPPIYDFKVDTPKHMNFKYTGYVTKELYNHGKHNHSSGVINRYDDSNKYVEYTMTDEEYKKLKYVVLSASTLEENLLSNS